MNVHKVRLVYTNNYNKEKYDDNHYGNDGEEDGHWIVRFIGRIGVA